MGDGERCPAEGCELPLLEHCRTAERPLLREVEGAIHLDGDLPIDDGNVEGVALLQRELLRKRHAQPHQARAHLPLERGRRVPAVHIEVAAGERLPALLAQRGAHPRRVAPHLNLPPERPLLQLRQVRPVHDVRPRAQAVDAGLDEAEVECVGRRQRPQRVAHVLCGPAGARAHAASLPRLGHWRGHRRVQPRREVRGARKRVEQVGRLHGREACELLEVAEIVETGGGGARLPPGLLWGAVLADLALLLLLLLLLASRLRQLGVGVGPRVVSECVRVVSECVRVARLLTDAVEPAAIGHRGALRGALRGDRAREAEAAARPADRRQQGRGRHGGRGADAAEHRRVMKRGWRRRGGGGGPSLGAAGGREEAVSLSGGLRRHSAARQEGGRRVGDGIEEAARAVVGLGKGPARVAELARLEAADEALRDLCSGVEELRGHPVAVGGQAEHDDYPV